MSKLILPGLIDPHVHLRDPGQTYKEDFYTGTSAALAGGFTTILDMPNNKTPIATLSKLNEKIKIARKKIVCDVGFYFSSLGNNVNEFQRVKNKVLGLKLYLNETTGNLLIDRERLESIFTAWSTSLHSNRLYVQKPILAHAEDDMLGTVIKLVKKLGNKVHVCHIATASDLKQIIKAREKKLPITCGVTPHHLFLTETDVKRLGPFGKMKPPLQSRKDQNFLWKNLKFIDVIESDHAPHTKAEKEIEGWRTRGTPVERPQGSASWRRPRMSDGGEARQYPEISKAPFGVPGLETALPLLLTAVSEKRLTIDDIVRLCHTNPAKIFGIKTDPQTKIIVDLNSSFIIHNSSLFTKCGWSPFNEWCVKGKVEKVWIRGKKVFENGKILAKHGSGKIVFFKPLP